MGRHLNERGEILRTLEGDDCQRHWPASQPRAGQAPAAGTAGVELSELRPYERPRERD